MVCLIDGYYLLLRFEQRLYVQLWGKKYLLKRAVDNHMMTIPWHSRMSFALNYKEAPDKICNKYLQILDRPIS
uniref:Uncharacterized protein n=1 Tax=Lepeophtheirus salmonis TaxID=72036 RepID=A0A0K2T588_LEPSM